MITKTAGGPFGKGDVVPLSGVLNTDGSFYIRVDMCAYCKLDTGGNHEVHFPITTEAPTDEIIWGNPFKN